MANRLAYGSEAEENKMERLITEVWVEICIELLGNSPECENVFVSCEYSPEDV